MATLLPGAGGSLVAASPGTGGAAGDYRLSGLGLCAQRRVALPHLTRMV